MQTERYTADAMYCVCAGIKSLRLKRNGVFEETKRETICSIERNAMGWNNKCNYGGMYVLDSLFGTK